MLNDEAMERLTEVLVDRIEELNTTILEAIGKAIKEIGTLTPSKAYQLAQTLKYGGDYYKIIKKLEQITSLNERQIDEIFKEVAKKNQQFAKVYYDYRGIEFVPYEQNGALRQQVEAMATLTKNTYTNLMNTSAFRTIENGRLVYTPLSQIYQKTIDKAILSVVQGKESYTSQMRKTMRELAENGIRTVDYASGYSRRLDSSVRMNMLDGLRTMSNQIQEDFGEEFDADGVEISVHEYPAPDHEEVQGKQYFMPKDGEEEKKYKQVDGVRYKNFNILNESLDRPISTLNCYHYIFSVVLGVNNPEYSKEQLDKINEKNEKGFDFEGKHYSLYEGTQLQRQIETKIRTLKDRQIGARAMNDMDEVGKCQKNIRILTSKYNQLCQVSGLQPKKIRMQVSGYRRVKVN